MADKMILNMDRVMNPVPVSFKNEIEGLERGLLLEIVGKATNNHWLDSLEDFEAYKVQLANANTKKGDLLVHTTVPKQYDERLTERDFALEKGKIGRGHYIQKGDEYTFAEAMVADVSAIGDEVQLAADGKLAKVTDGEAVGEVIRIYNWNGQDSITIRFY